MNIEFQVDHADVENKIVRHDLFFKLQKSHKIMSARLTAPEGEYVYAALRMAKRICESEVRIRVAGARFVDEPLVHSFKATFTETGTLTGQKIRYLATEDILPVSYFGEVVPPETMQQKVGPDRRQPHGVCPNTGGLYFLEPGERVYDQKTLKLLHAEPAS